MEIAVLEDNGEERAALCQHIQQYFERKNYAGQLHPYGNAEKLLADFQPGRFDVLFLDIFLPGLSGLDLARKIRETDQDCILILVTASPDYSMEGYLVNATGYITKPVTREKIDHSLHQCREVLARAGRVIRIPQAGQNLPVLLAKVEYIEVFKNESIFHTTNGLLKTRLPLDNIEALLGGEPFLRCHRSFIVNMNYIKKVAEADILMQCDDAVPIRKNGKRETRLAIARFIAGQPADQPMEEKNEPNVL